MADAPLTWYLSVIVSMTQTSTEKYKSHIRDKFYVCLEIGRVRYPSKILVDNDRLALGVVFGKKNKQLEFQHQTDDTFQHADLLDKVMKKA